MTTPWKVTRSDGTVAHKIRYRFDGVNGSITLESADAARKFFRLWKAPGGSIEAALAVYAPERLAPATLADPTVADYLADYVEHLTGIKAATRAKYRRILANDLDPALGHHRLAGLEHKHIAAWVNQLERDKVSGKTIKNKLAVLRAALNDAVRTGVINANPAIGIKVKATLPTKPPMFLTETEFQTVLDNVDEYYHPLIEFLVATGCRWGEVSALKPRHINRAEATVTIEQARSEDGARGFEIGVPKTASSTRMINVDPEILDRLNYGADDEWVFTHPDGAMLNPQRFFKYTWRPMWAAMPAHRQPRIHDLRHTCASWMLADGIPLYAVSKHLGHSTIKTTADTYGHLERKAYQKAAAAVGARLRKTRKAKLTVVREAVLA